VPPTIRTSAAPFLEESAFNDVRHKHRASGRWHTTRLNGHEFMRRFLQHVLPKGLHKVRYSGLWHHSRCDHAGRARQLLALDRSEAQDRSRGLPIPLRGEIVPQHRRPRSRAAARAARLAISSMCACSTLDRCVDHDRIQCVPAIAPARAGHATHRCGPPLPLLRAPAAIGWDAPQSRAQITTSVPHRTAKDSKASPESASQA